ncbi:MAG: hypothetical protein ACRBEQ_12335 [Hyphomonas sp.]
MTNREDAAPRILFLTGHDYRRSPRGTIHFLVDEMVKNANVRVFTPGISEILRFKGAFPAEARELAYNKVFEHQGVTNYVWRTPLHPFNLRKKILEPVSRAAFDLYRRVAPPILTEWAKWADIIIVESGLPVLFLESLSSANPAARLVYFSSDSLETIGCDPYLNTCLERAVPKIAYACVLSEQMQRQLPPDMRCVKVPQGVDPSIVNLAGPSPYGAGQHMVSIGAMLFDAEFFHIAANAFPDVTFHVIGSQANPESLPPQVEWYPTMPFEKLPSFIRHADAGIAPYRDSPGATYLRDTSLKLIQYGLFGIPAICPDFAAADREKRFGYRPGDAESICAAIKGALACTDRASVPSANWVDVAQRVLAPADFADTKLPMLAANI